MSGSARFYITGGTLPSDAESYVPRKADAELVANLLAGEFCYVLNTRQMGKSSLMVRTAERLRESGCVVVVLDLTALGQNVTAEQWYDGLVSNLGRELDIEDELDDFWRASKHLGPMQRWIGALRDVVLHGFAGTVVIFVDEIDVVRGLPFATDEFFAGIRECYNGRRRKPELNRLTFCLLGVATPANLIRDTRMTPFNIGRRIDLNDFTDAEAAPLAAGLCRRTGNVNPTTAAAISRQLLSRVFYWTGGHPYLTQRLCQAVAEDANAATPADVDRHCRNLFLSRSAQERDDNLLFVRDRIVRTEGDLSALLDLYGRICSGSQVASDDLRPGVTALLLSGIVRADAGRLRIRNRIYERVFDRAWVRERMPAAEARRQQAAYRRGQIRAAALGFAVVLAIAVLASNALLYAKRADRNRHDAEARTQEARAIAEKLENALAAQRRAVRSRDTAIHRLKQALEEADRQRTRANGAASQARQEENLARRAQQAADRNRQEAERARRSAQDRLVRLVEQNGIRAQDSGDAFGALLSFTEAARLDAHNPAALALHRLRIASALRYAPRLQRMWFRVRTARLSADGSRAILAQGDGTALVLDTARGEPVAPPIRHGAGLKLASLSADGSRALTIDDHHFCVWDVLTGRALSGFIATADPIFRCALSPDGRRAAILTDPMDNVHGRTTRVFDISHPGRTSSRLVVPGLFQEFSPDGQHIVITTHDLLEYDLLNRAAPLRLQLGTPPGADAANCAALSPDGMQIAGGGTGDQVNFFDRKGAALPISLRAKKGVVSVEYSPDGKSLLLLSDDGIVKIADAADLPRPLRSLASDVPILHASFSPDSRRIVTGDANSAARVWDAQSGEPLSTSLVTNGKITCAEIGRDGHHLFTADSSGIVRLWDIAGAAEPEAFVGEIGNVRGIALSRDGRRLATYDFDWGARVWDTNTQRPVTQQLQHGGQVADMAFSPDASLLATISADGEGRIWDIKTGRVRVTLPHHPETDLRFVAFRPDGRLVATASANVVRIWDARTGRRIAKTAPFPPGEHTTGLEFSPDGRHIALATGLNAWPKGAYVRLYDTKTAAVVRVLPHPADVTSVAYSPDGRRLLTGCADGCARIWNLNAPQLPQHMLYAGQIVLSAVFRPDGRRILTTSGDTRTSSGGEARIWNADTGEAVGLPLKHPRPVTFAAWSPDGRLIATCSDDRTVRVWDAASCEPVTPPLPHLKPLRKALFQPQGSLLVTLSSDGGARIWDLRQPCPPLDRLDALAKALSSRRTNRDGGLSPLQVSEVERAWRASAFMAGKSAVIPRQELAWQSQEAVVEYDAGAWAQALIHLDRALEAEPNDRRMRMLRIQAHASLGHWSEVAADQAKLGTSDAKIVVLASHDPLRQTRHGDPSLRIGEACFSDGLSCTSPNRIMVLLPSPGKRFTASVGMMLDDTRLWRNFKVVVAGRVAFQSDVRSPHQPPVRAEVDLHGATAFDLSTDHGLNVGSVWAMARVELANGRSLRLCDLPVLYISEF